MSVVKRSASSRHDIQWDGLSYDVLKLVWRVVTFVGNYNAVSTKCCSEIVTPSICWEAIQAAIAFKVKVEAAGRNSFSIDSCARRRIVDRLWFSIEAGVVPLPNHDEGDVGKLVRVKPNHPVLTLADTVPIEEYVAWKLAVLGMVCFQTFKHHIAEILDILLWI